MQVELSVAPDTYVDFQTKLRPLSTAASAVRHSGLSRGVFRYQPSIDSDPASPPRLTIELQPGASGAATTNDLGQ